MWLPLSFPTALALALTSLACWGSWSNAAKAAGDLPFPLFYLDFSSGVFSTAILVFLSLGSSQFTHDGSAFAWDVPALSALCAGGVFNVANVLLVAGIGLAGLAVAFPVAIGTALVLGTTLTFFIDSGGADPSLLFAGVGVAFTAILVQVAANLSYKRDVEQGKDSPLAAAAAGEVSAWLTDEQRLPNEAELCEAAPAPAHGTWYGIGVCAVSGLLMASWSPLSALSMDTNRFPSGSLTPYGSSLLFTAAVFVTSPVLCKILMVYPLVGPRSTYRAYFELPPVAHMWGLLGGVVWAVGTIANLISGDKLSLALSYAIGQAAPMVATLWGLLYYHEFRGARAPTYLLVLGMMMLYSLAVVLVAASKGADHAQPPPPAPPLGHA